MEVQPVYFPDGQDPYRESSMLSYYAKKELTVRLGLLPAWYRVAVDPPRGSGYLPGSALVAPATTEHVSVQVLLLPSP